MTVIDLSAYRKSLEEKEGLGIFSDEEILLLINSINNINEATEEEILTYIQWANEIRIKSTVLDLILQGKALVAVTGDSPLIFSKE